MRERYLSPDLEFSPASAGCRGWYGSRSARLRATMALEPAEPAMTGVV